jgi:hypothetical protein
MKPRSIRNLFTAAALVLPAAALAHDGHGNTPLHALMHMLEQNGVVIGLLLVAGVGTLVWRAHKQRTDQRRTVNAQERRRDSR